MCFSVQRTLINIPLSTQCWVLPQFVCCLYYSSSFKHHQWVTVCHLSTKGSLVTGLLQFSPPTHDPRSKFWALSSCLWLHHSWWDTRDVTHMRRCLFHLDTIPSPPPTPPAFQPRSAPRSLFTLPTRKLRVISDMFCFPTRSLPLWGVLRRINIQCSVTWCQSSFNQMLLFLSQHVQVIWHL